MWLVLVQSQGQLQLPGSQQALVEAVAAAQPNYIVVFINGGALGTDWIAKNSPAVIEAFYPVRPYVQLMFPWQHT